MCNFEFGKYKNFNALFNSKISVEKSGISRFFKSSRHYCLENGTENKIFSVVSKTRTGMRRDLFSREIREERENGGKTDVLTTYCIKKIHSEIK